ncbi:MAG: hypothetical protein WBP45_15665 [Daejeonella sp.]
MNELLSNQIQLFKSVFKGREDVFAVRWEKEKKSGYMPAYFYDPYMYRVHKTKGGTFQNFTNKTYLKLTDQEIAKHLNGEQLIGVYPLLQDSIGASMQRWPVWVVYLWHYISTDVFYPIFHFL